MFAERTVLVTGGTGLIGSHFVEELLQLGARVRIVVHRRPSTFGDAVETLSGDLTRWETCTRAVAGVDVVVHAAGVSGGSKYVTVAPVAMFTDSLLMNTLILEAARRAGVERFLFVSNSSVYAPSDPPLKEADAWGATTRGAPENETGMVKRVGETQCALYARTSSMRIAISRGGNAYGANDNFDLESSHVVPALIRKAVERQDPYVLWGSGEALRDFIHARDIARGGLFLLEHHCVAEPVNVATGVPTRILDLARLILELAGHESAELKLAGNAPPASPAKRLDVTKMRELGFEPKISLRDGVRQTIEWFRERYEASVPT